MKEINGQESSAGTNENERVGKLFYLLAAAQIAQILIGAVLGFFVAPASLFVSRTDDEAFIWLAAAFAGVVTIALGLILIVPSIIAAKAFNDNKKRRCIIGFATAGLAIFAFPCGTILGGCLIRKIVKLKKPNDSESTENL